jgi:predicted phage terminase large subunit-like protein
MTLDTLDSGGILENTQGILDGSTSAHTNLGAHSQAQLERLLSNYRITPATLMSELCDWWLPAPFLQYLSAEIARAVTMGGCGLLVSAPPRHGKSKLITVATPLWVLERFPQKNVIVATYGEDLSTDFTREVKDLIVANPDKLSVRLRKDVTRVANFLTTKGGGLKAVGLRGTITGRGADVLIIDDYIKEPKEALSHDYLEGIKTWYTTVARTRLEPGAVVIIVATRWVTGDLHGHIERLEARRPKPFYKIVKIPAIATLHEDPITGEEIPDFLGRTAGQALFPQRYDVEALENIRYELQNRWFEAMFQQNPLAEDGAVTNPDDLRFITKDDFVAMVERSHNQPDRFKWVRSWDLASTKDGGDYTVGPLTCYDTQEHRMYVLEMPRGQWSPGRVETQFKAFDESDPVDAPFLIEQEPGSQGTYAMEHFKKMIPNRKVFEVKSASSGSKLLKAEPVIAAAERHQLWIVEGQWNRAFIDEYTSFPEGANDDQMDAIANAYNHLTGKKPMKAAWGRGQKVDAARAKLQAQKGILEGPKTSRNSATFGRRSKTNNLGQQTLTKRTITAIRRR